jgi:hypothetical protein
MAYNILKLKNLLVILIVLSSFYAGKAVESHVKTKEPASALSEKSEKIFVIHAPISDLDEFRELTRQAARLKPYGRVEVNVSKLDDKGFHEIPEGRNYWYEYASYNPTPYKFFSDPKIAPFIPTDFVKKNRELLVAKAKILREFGLGGAFWSYELNFLPEEILSIN